ncbi:hypothetical protein Btru_040128 [Bulinus truncatus]|nr:hypothetical protein Btru_040128 [Bulinus truncatus]
MECMKERLVLWENVFTPLRLVSANMGYVLHIVDDLWSSTNLEKAYSHLFCLQSSEGDDEAAETPDEFDTNIAHILVTGAKDLCIFLTGVLCMAGVAVPDSCVVYGRCAVVPDRSVVYGMCVVVPDRCVVYGTCAVVPNRCVVFDRCAVIRDRCAIVHDRCVVYDKCSVVRDRC